MRALLGVSDKTGLLDFARGLRECGVELIATSGTHRALGDASLSETAGTMARAAVLGARGNSGMMLAHFLLGLAEGIGERETASAPRITCMAQW